MFHTDFFSDFLKVHRGGATEILSLLGKKISMERIKKSLAKLQEL